MEHLVEKCVIDLHRLDGDCAAGFETDIVQPTESGRILILLADRLLQDIEFNVACFFG